MVEYSTTSHIARGGLLAIYRKRMAKLGRLWSENETSQCTVVRE